MMMQIAERDQLLPLQLAKISSNHFHLHYDVLVSSDVKDLKIQVNWADFEVYPNRFELGNSIYDEANPKTSGLKKDLIYNEANPNLFVSSSPEPPNICAAGSSSSMQQKYPLKSDDTLTINICSADNTQLFFISFDIFLLINDFEFPATEF